jgi:hypothetical protein
VVADVIVAAVGSSAGVLKLAILLIALVPPTLYATTVAVYDVALIMPLKLIGDDVAVETIFPGCSVAE